MFKLSILLRLIFLITLLNTMDFSFFLLLTKSLQKLLCCEAEACLVAAHKSVPLLFSPLQAPMQQFP